MIIGSCIIATPGISAEVDRSLVQEMRSYQCPPDSCRNPLESSHSSGFWWNKIWQEGLLKFSFWLLFIAAESGHSRIETGMVCRMAGMECNQNLVVWLYHLPNKQLFGIGLHTQCQTWPSLFFPPHSSPPPTFTTTASLWHHPQWPELPPLDTCGSPTMPPPPNRVTWHVNGSPWLATSMQCPGWHLGATLLLAVWQREWQRYFVVIRSLLLWVQTTHLTLLVTDDIQVPHCHGQCGNQTFIVFAWSFTIPQQGLHECPPLPCNNGNDNYLPPPPFEISNRPRRPSTTTTLQWHPQPPTTPFETSNGDNNHPPPLPCNDAHDHPPPLHKISNRPQRPSTTTTLQWRPRPPTTPFETSNGNDNHPPPLPCNDAHDRPPPLHTTSTMQNPQTQWGSMETHLLPLSHIKSPRTQWGGGVSTHCLISSYVLTKPLKPNEAVFGTPPWFITMSFTLNDIVNIFCNVEYCSL